MYTVNAGDVWEADERVFYIINACLCFENPFFDKFDYLELTTRLDRMHVSRGHLTIRSRSHLENLWKRIA